MNDRFKTKKVIGWGCGLLGGGCLTLLFAPIGLWLFYVWLYQPYDLRPQDELNQGYQVEFSELLPEGVQVLKGRQCVFLDSGGQYLLMKMSPTEIDRHIQMGFERRELPSDDFREPGPGSRPPWWKLPLPDRTEYYQNLSWTKRGGWYGSQAFMAVDRQTGIVWLSCDKTD